MMNISKKLSDQVAHKISKDIDEHKYKAGEKIPAEPELMKLYNVGRSTIREAIKTLTMTGALKVQQGSGTFVNIGRHQETIEQQLRRADFDEINAVRKLLEMEMVRLATQNYSDSDIAEMERCLENRRLAILADQRQVCVDADIAFHIAISKASSNKVLADLYQSFTSIIRNFFSQRENHGISHFAMSHHLHEQLFEAIKGKNGNKARIALGKILENNY